MVRKWYRDGNTWLAAAVLLASLGVYTATMNPTIDFWDCGEFVAVSHIVGVPHQPGTPLYVIMGRVFIILFGQPDLAEPSFTSAWAVNFMSAFFSALAAMLVYLIIVRVARRADPDSGLLAHLGGLVGAFFLVFSDTAWINAVEAEVYGLAAFMMALLTWLALVWYDNRKQPRSDWILLLLVYLCGLGVGFHLGALLVYPAFFVLVWLARDRQLPILDLLLVSSGLALFLASTTFITDQRVLTVLMVLLLAGCVLRMIWPRLGKSSHAKPGARPRLFPFALIGLLLFGVGLSVHWVLLIRAGADPEPAINQTAPADFETLMSVVRREQYPPLNPLDRKAPLSFQYGYYYDFLLRQFTFLPHANPGLEKASVLIGPLLLALLGMTHILRRARPVAWLLLLGYLINADGLTLYLNFTANEVRERDYFYFAAFLFAAVFIGLGVAALLRWTSGPLGPSQGDLERRREAQEPQRPFSPTAVVYQVIAAFTLSLIVMAMTPGEIKERWLGLFLFAGAFAGLALAPWLTRVASTPGAKTNPPAWSERSRSWRLGSIVTIGALVMLGFWILHLFAGPEDEVFILGIYFTLLAGQVLCLGERTQRSMKPPESDMPERKPAPVRVDKLSWVAGGALVILAALPAIGSFDSGLHRKWFTHDRSQNRIAYEYAYNILAGLDRDAILFTNGDNDTFPVWYLQEVEHFRRDVTVVNLSLVNLAWYTKQIKRLPRPAPLSYTDEQIDDLRARQYRDPDTGELFILFIRDFVVHDIIVANRAGADPRPVFFAVTIPRENMERYYPMLQMEGLAYRLTDSSSPDGMPSTDPERLLANFFGTYLFDSLTTGDTAARLDSFTSQAGWSDDAAPHEMLTGLSRPMPVDYRSMAPLIGRERTDIYRDPNTSNLLGNYPASIARAGITFLEQAENLFQVSDPLPAQQAERYDFFLDRALLSYELALRFDPNSILVAAGGYPALLLEIGRLDSALAYVDGIHGKMPESIELEAVRSTVVGLMTLNKTDVAVSWLEERIILDPSWRLGYEMLFRVHEAEGLVNEAAGVVERWREVHGQDDPALRYHLDQMRDRAQQQDRERLERAIRESGVQPEEP